jgi:hypothetical protein
MMERKPVKEIWANLVHEFRMVLVVKLVDCAMTIMPISAEGNIWATAFHDAMDKTMELHRSLER